MTELFLAWFGFTASIVTIGACLDLWLEEDVRASLSKALNTRLSKNPAEWFHSVEEAFSAVFDYIYGWRKPQLNRLIWRAILFCYLVLMLARIVLWIFMIPVPPMERILVTTFIIAIGLTILLHAGLAVLRLSQVSENMPLRTVITNRDFVLAVALGGIGVFIYTAAAVLTGYGMGRSLKIAIAIAFGAGIGVPAVALVSWVKDSVIAVAPLRAVVSSLFFVGLLAFLFPTAAYSFIPELERVGPIALATIAFNLFGDAVSLVETRWMLYLSRGLSIPGIIGLLLLDLVLSGFIYLVMPSVTGLDWSIFVSAIVFQGSMPWMGILFWSTFSTSLLFYLFVASILSLRLLTPIARLISKLDNWFAIYKHPVRLITISMAVVETFGFAVWAIFR